MGLIYAKTNEITLEVFIEYCFQKLSKNYTKNLSEFFNNWKTKLIYSYRINYIGSSCILMNEKGFILGTLSNIPDFITPDYPAWNIDNIDYLTSYEEEYFDFDKFEHLIEKEKYKIIKAGLNRKNDWIYLQIENKFTNHRTCIINLKNIKDLKSHIRKEKINRLLEDEQS